MSEFPPPTPKPPNWYADPQARHEYRYWDGHQWTVHVSDNGVASIEEAAPLARPPVHPVERIEPARPVRLKELSDEWIGEYNRGILLESGLPADDGQNEFQLHMFALTMLLDHTARTCLKGMGALSVLDEYNTLSARGATPTDRIGFLVAWNPEMHQVLVDKFARNRAVILQGVRGARNGRVRYFRSKCCVEPVEFTLTDGSPYCSSCVRPVEFTAPDPT